jgi:hypothetical protein
VSRVDVATVSDRLRVLHSEVHDVMANDSLTPHAKSTALSAIMSRVSCLMYVGPTEFRQQEELRGFIKEYQEQLARSITDPLSLATLGALVATRQRAIPLDNLAAAAASVEPPSNYTSYKP